MEVIYCLGSIIQKLSMVWYNYGLCFGSFSNLMPSTLLLERNHSCGQHIPSGSPVSDCKQKFSVLHIYHHTDTSVNCSYNYAYPLLFASAYNIFLNCHHIQLLILTCIHCMQILQHNFYPFPTVPSQCSIHQYTIFR